MKTITTMFEAMLSTPATPTLSTPATPTWTSTPVPGGPVSQWGWTG